MRYACIDIGSNTTRLLVAEPDGGGLREVLAQRVFTRLGGRGTISAEKIAEVAEVVAAQVRDAREAGADDVCAVATAAIRAAGNGAELCAAVHARSGERVRVLSGADEARLAFRGAISTLSTSPDGPIAVVDVGGGSTEVVCGTPSGGVDWTASLPIGSALLSDHHVRSDPPDPAALEHLRRHVEGVFAGLRAPAAVAAYAVGGSATSLGRMVGPVLDHASLAQAIGMICAEPSAAIAGRLGLHEERARLLPAGLLILDAAALALGLPLRIAGGGLREGVILERIGSASPE